MKKKLFVTLFVVVICVMLTGCSDTAKLNETVDIKKDSIKLTILESENYTIKGDEITVGDETYDLSLASGDYTRVKLTIENYGNENYTWTLLNFKLGEDMASLNALSQSDVISTSIASGETATGYIYFPVNDSNVLTYTTNMVVTSEGNVETEKFEFKVK